MKYSKGYKYKLEEEVTIRVPFSCFTMPHFNIETPFISLAGGMLTIREGYAWNGASGPVLDTSSVMFGSLIHDAWYQMIREEYLPMWTRPHADDWFGDLCVEDGLFRWTADMYVEVLKECGEKFARKKTTIIEVTR